MNKLIEGLGDASFWQAVQSAGNVASALVPRTRRRAAAVRTARVRLPDPLQIEYLGPAPVIRPQPGEGCDYQIVGGIDELRRYLQPSFEARRAFGSDWETSSLNPALAQLVGWSCSVAPKTGRYVPVGHTLSPGDNLPLPEVLKVIRDLDEAQAFSIWYNASYDMEVLQRRTGWEPQYWHDAQIAVYLTNSNVIELNLKSTALRLLRVKMQTLEELDEEWIVLSQKARKLTSPKLPHQLPAAKVGPYGCADSDCTRQLFFLPEVQTHGIKSQSQVFALEEALIPVMREGIAHGVYLDVPRLAELQQEALARLDELRPDIFETLGCEPFKLSQKQVLADRLIAVKAIGGIDKNANSPTFGAWVVEKTKKGQIATNKKVLDKHRKQHPVVPKLIEYAELEAQERNYIRKLIKAAQHFEQEPWAAGRCRFAFNSIGVPTGRMKCGGAGKGGEAYAKGSVDVNGQSLPDHEKAPYLPNTRSAIVAPPGYVIVAADYSQIELRIAANLSREPVWVQAYHDDKDLHLVNAQAIANFREPGLIVQPDDKMRRGKAKTTSFALLYGGDEYTVARNAGIPVDEAKQVLDAFFMGLPHLKHWIDVTHASARTHKQVRTFLGRVRHLEQYFLPEPSKRDFRQWKLWKKQDARGCREAVNDPIQGGAADIFKIACVLLRRAVKEQGWGLDIISPQVFWVHDEVVFYVKQEWVSRVVPVLRAAMEFPITGWPVPIRTEFEVGSRLLYARAKVAKAEKDEKLAPEVQAREIAKWSAIASLPDISNYGEMVGLDSWVGEYAPTQLAA